MSYFSGTVNVVPKGGSTTNDDRAGLGIGALHKHPASGLGDSWSMGDALSSPKGEWDNSLELEEDEFEDIDDEIERKSFSAFNRIPTDSLAYKGTSIGYLGGIGSDMSAVIGLSAGYNAKGQVVAENQLKEYIREALIAENSVSAISSSGRIAVLSRPKGKNLGSEDDDAYGEPLASTNTADAAPQGHLPTSRSAFNYDGYTNKTKTPSILPYVKIGKATTDGAETLHDPKVAQIYLEDEESFENGESTGSIASSYDNERIDNLNIKKHI
tara:strand:+ start:64 stop:873 length:810 start_codon:yes stop_codon:yes gene_type:complete